MNPYINLAYNLLQEFIPETFSYREAPTSINGIKVKAKVLAWLMQGEDTYITYTYSVDDNHFLFAWMTPFDERHRAWGNHPTEWYDTLKAGIEFEVEVDKNDPNTHRITNSEYEKMNKGIIFFTEEK